ncbi:hypothetical protein ACQP2P_14685 [Dactylosporangium sp. CA-139114]|uniref:hypothetical protein n=1 Tax=Dactylosporangium sp. CA-139114 TaxID=3239931 RepID=UPI003D96CE14
MTMRAVDHRDITDVEQLNALEREQLRIAGVRYDGEDLPVEDRLDPEGDEETSFHGFCGTCRIVDGPAHRYDVWLYQVDSGTVFRAGTTEAVADVIQAGLECHDPGIAAELEEAWPSVRAGGGPHSTV